MNKQECKKYITRAYKSLIAKNKSISEDNIEMEMKEQINNQCKEYVAYAKIAVNDMKSSANSVITLSDLIDEIDILPRIYTPVAAIEKAKNI